MSQFNSKDFAPKKTAKGTELPLMNLKGKPYLQVAHRLVWFREEHPLGRIETELLQVDEKACLARARVYVEGNLVGSGHKKESEAHFGDFIEKAETGAIGRALAMAGYGTQFDPDLDEQDRIVDSPMPVAKRKPLDAPTKPTPARPVVAVAPNSGTAPATLTREETLTKIGEAARVVVAKKVLATNQADTGKALTSYMTEKYGKSTKEGLTDDELKSFYAYLKSLI